MRLDRQTFVWVAKPAGGPPGTTGHFSGIYAFPGSKPKTVLEYPKRHENVLLINPVTTRAYAPVGYFMIFFPEKSLYI